MILRPGPHRGDANASAIILEHGRRNMALHADGRLAIVCPVTDKGDDPAVQAGVLVYQVYGVRGFPCDALPG